MDRDQVAEAVGLYVLELVPPALRDTPQCLALLKNMSGALADLVVGSKGFDGGPASADRLARAAIAYRDSLDRLSEWARQLEAAADEAKDATTH
jgi:hypothetical protein